MRLTGRAPHHTYSLTAALGEAQLSERYEAIEVRTSVSTPVSMSRSGICSDGISAFASSESSGQRLPSCNGGGSQLSGEERAEDTACVRAAKGVRVLKRMRARRGACVTLDACGVVKRAAERQGMRTNGCAVADQVKD